MIVISLIQGWTYSLTVSVTVSYLKLWCTLTWECHEHLMWKPQKFRAPILATPHGAFCISFTSDHVFWILRDLTLRTSWDPATRRMESQFCWVLDALESQRDARRLSNGAQMLGHALLIFSDDSSSPAREQMRKIWTMYVFSEGWIDSKFKVRYSILDFFLSLLCLSIIYFMK